MFDGFFVAIPTGYIIVRDYDDITIRTYFLDYHSS